MLRKKEQKQEYWPRLLKESKKVHFLKTDFDKARLGFFFFPASVVLWESADVRASGLMRTSKMPRQMMT